MKITIAVNMQNQMTRRNLFILAILLWVMSLFTGQLGLVLWVPAVLILIYLKGLQISTIIFLCSFGLSILIVVLYLLANSLTPTHPDVYILSSPILIIGILAFALPTRLDTVLRNLINAPIPAKAIRAKVFRRFLATLLDGLLLGLVGASILAIVGLVTTVYMILIQHIDYSKEWQIFGSGVGPLFGIGFTFGAIGTIGGSNNLLLALAYIWGLSRASGQQSTLLIAVIAIALINVACWIYYVLMETSRHQATIGKLVLGLCVVDQNGQGLSVKHANLRYFMKLLSFTGMGLGYLYIVMSPNRRALHDILTKTFVVKKSGCA